MQIFRLVIEFLLFALFIMGCFIALAHADQLNNLIISVKR